MAIGRAVAQVFAIALNMIAIEESFNLSHESFVEGIRTTNRKRQTVTRQRVTLTDPIELVLCLITALQPVFWRYFPKIDGRSLCQYLMQKLPPQAKAYATPHLPSPHLPSPHLPS